MIDKNNLGRLVRVQFYSDESLTTRIIGIGNYKYAVRASEEYSLGWKLIGAESSNFLSLKGICPRTLARWCSEDEILEFLS